MKWICVMMMVLLYCTEAQGQIFVLVDPYPPLVVATLGSDLILPCSIRSSISAVEMRVKWIREDLNNAVVHLYENQHDISTDQIESYRNRTSVFKEELQRGNTSLLLKKTRLSDEGIYQCRVESRHNHDQISFTVRATPVITIEKIGGGSATLLCEYKGGRPLSDAVIQWRDSKGAVLTGGATETHTDSEFFSVKQRLTVEKSDTVSCRVTQGAHVMEEYFTIPFVGLNAGAVAGIIIAVLILVVAGVVWIVYKIQKGKGTHPDTKMNLLKNPNGDKGLKFWELTENGGNEWRVEEVPGDCGHSFCDDSLTKYFTTSFELCLKKQVVDLVAKGYAPEDLDNQPAVTVEDWYSGRTDCGCVYQLTVRLLNKDKQVIQEYNPDCVALDPEDSTWRQITHTFTEYGPGMRYISFEHGGQDTNFWDGWYGVRVTGSSITIDL